jgi:hypothetical protein
VIQVSCFVNLVCIQEYKPPVLLCCAALRLQKLVASKSGFKAGVRRRCPRRRWARECTMLHAMGMTRTFCTCFLPAQPWTSRVCG